MEVGFRRSNFAQFSDDLWLYVKVDNTKLEFDISKQDIPVFVEQLLSVAYDAMHKLGCEAACGHISSAMDSISDH